MPRTPEAVKKRIMSSESYKDWVRQRIAMGNVPADVFRAYQIDRSLKANIRPREEWKKEPNRMDVVPIDYPMGSVRPIGKRRIPTHRPPAKPEAPKTPSTPLGRELKWRAREVAHRYKVPIPDVELTGSTYRHSQQQTRINPLTQQPVGRSVIRIGVKGAEKKATKKIMLGVFYHELGHHVDAYLGFKQLGRMNPQFLREAMRSQFGDIKAKVATERRAWRYAEPYMKGKGQSLRRWTKNYALGTYQGRITNVVRED